MTKIKKTGFSISLVALLMVGVLSNVYAEKAFICDSHIENQTIDTEVLVPSGETCEFSEVTVNGNIIVQKKANFNVLVDSTINGNLSANHASEINITELKLYGNISILNSEIVHISQATVIFGDVLFSGNEFVDLFEQGIFGNAIISNNNRVDVADVGILGNLNLINNGQVNSDTDPDFYLSVFGHATCQQNDEINGVINAIAKNNGCPLPL